MTRDDNRRFDEESIRRAFKDKMSGLDEYIPPTPPFNQIQAAGAPRVSAGSRANVGSGRLGRASALLAAAAVVALVVAAVFVPRAILPVANPTPTPSVASSPTASVTPSTAPSAQVIYNDFAADVAWSPDGTKLAFSDNDAQSSKIHVMGTDGREVSSIPGYEVAWVDEGTVAVLDSNGHVSLNSVGRSLPNQIDGGYRDLIGGRGGSVALTLAVSSGYEYKVWSPGSGLSVSREGQPVAFSPDGTKLAVVHDPERCCVGTADRTPSHGLPTLDVTDARTGRSLARYSAIAQSGTLGYLVAFNPDGSRIAFLSRVEAGTSPVGILDIAGGKTWLVQPGRNDISEERGQFIWLDSSHLEIVPWQSGTPAAGMPVAVFYGNYESYLGATSSGGAVARIRGGRDQNGAVSGSDWVTTTAASGATRQIQLPATAWDVIWSPDASRLAVLCGPPDGAGTAGWSLLIVEP